MPYVIVNTKRDLKHYVQRLNGTYRLNGLLNNAMIFDDPLKATAEIPRIEDKLGKKLYLHEIKERPKT